MFITNGVIDYEELGKAQALSTRLGIRMALIKLELPEWDKRQKRDRLIGTSLTGFEDAMGDFDEDTRKDILNFLKSTTKAISEIYSHKLRIPTPLLATTVKPEGTLSLVAGGVSPGLHSPHSNYFIRRIRVNSTDPLVQVAREAGWTINPEIGQSEPNVRSYVIDFYVKSTAKNTKDNVGALAQLNRYLMFQKHYTDHNSSNTISVKPDEWAPLEKAIAKNWKDFVGVSFLSHDGGTYQLAPFEAISEDEYNSKAPYMVPFTPEMLQKYESGEDHELDLDDPDCATGSCPVR